MWAIRARLGDVQVHDLGEIPESGYKGGIYPVRHPAARTGVTCFLANFRGDFSGVYHDELYSLYINA